MSGAAGFDPLPHRRAGKDPCHSLGVGLGPIRRPTPSHPARTGHWHRGAPGSIKNQTLFIALARQLIQDGFQGRFVVIGDGELRSELERSAADMSDQITFTGWRRDLPEVYAGLSVVVNTSLNEGTPVALIEAMAAGVPVVATAVGGVPDVVRPGQTGWLAPVTIQPL